VCICGVVVLQHGGLQRRQQDLARGVLGGDGTTDARATQVSPSSFIIYVSDRLNLYNVFNMPTPPSDSVIVSKKVKSAT